MIYVHRNAGLIPQALLDKAAKAQEALEKLPESERPEFIRKHADIWRDFGAHLAKMSHGKCWYSESPEVQSFFDVDHYRPKLEARRTKDQCDRGYEWLAFSWENFRVSAQRSNRLNTNQDTEEVDGKGSWFPLLPDSPVACWEDRCVTDEKPILLDPTVRQDIALIDISATGYVVPGRFCVGSEVERVERSVRLYGLNLPRLVAARMRVMREIQEQVDKLQSDATLGNSHPSVADSLRVNRQVEQIRRKSLSCSPYSRAARAQLILAGCADLCAQPEDSHGMTGTDR